MVQLSTLKGVMDMTQEFEVGQAVRTVTGERAEIYAVEGFGSSIFYDCIVEGRGRMMIHQTKLIGAV